MATLEDKYLLNEDGTFLLNEDGTFLLLDYQISARNTKPLMVIVRGKI